MNEIKVSIITPLYKGTDYIPGLMAMIRKNADLLPTAQKGKNVSKAKLEFILVNDSPADGSLEEEELIEINPFHKVKTKFREEVILPKIIPRDIIEQLLNHLYKERSIKEYSEWRKKIILRDIAVVETLFSTGLRISELCHLQNKYVDLKNGVLCIQGKGGKERYLQIGNNDVLSILNAYKKSFEDEIKKQGYFFVNRYGNALSEQSARSMIHKYAGEIQADINITPHMFRHSFATYLMEEDVNIRYIQKMLGHASITTTQIYTYVTTEKEKEILQTRHPRNKINIGENFDNLVY